MPLKEWERGADGGVTLNYGFLRARRGRNKSQIVAFLGIPCRSKTLMNNICASFNVFVIRV
jgi:hypothetical protein